jgi:chorismate dehydratase
VTESDQPAPLRLAPRETLDDTLRRAEHEHRAAQDQRERALADAPPALARVGSVPYLNAVPLTRGIEDKILLVTPSKLGELLAKGELDAALVSVTFPLLNDGFDILDGIAVASLGEVVSVILAHRVPLADIRAVHCDPASLTSVNLLRVLLAERGLRPEFRTLEQYADAHRHEAALIIGDAAIDFTRGAHAHDVFDLGAAWYELTKLPFVYAVWALRRGVDTAATRIALREARDFGIETLDRIIRDRTEFDLAFRKDYLGWHIHYHMGADEKRGLAKFIELMRKHGIGPVYEPKFVA